MKTALDFYARGKQKEANADCRITIHVLQLNK